MRRGSLGPYLLQGEIGRGGMGVVYLARDTRLDREVAIKMLPEDVGKDPEQLARFRREARLLALLNHPNIATIYGIEQSESGERFLILERLEGETLARRLKSGPLPLEEAVAVCAQIAEALEAAHERNVVHRDLKPGNVMLLPRGRVKVLDFGLAKHIAGPAPRDGAPPPRDASRLTEAGTVLGTPGYMAPEQVLGLPHDRRADVFAFGCVLYECLAGRPAFAGDNPTTITAAVLAGAPAWAALPEGTPQPIRELIERCLEKDPEARPGDLAEARAALDQARRREWLSTARGFAAPPVTPQNLPRQLTSFIGRERELAQCAALLERAALLTLAGAGGCGKTRLALRLAEARIAQHPGGVWFVDLAPLADPARVPHVVAAAVGVREEPGKTPVETLCAALATRRALLVLDNCEHVLGACAELVEALLGACPELKLVATSREGLGVPGEQAFAVPTLSVPPPAAAPDAVRLSTYESVALFADRAALVQPGFTLDDARAAVVAEICRRLDGIPLAIELAAARVRVLAVEEIHARLDDRFRLLTGGSRTALPRHQTLRATLQWSYDHLEVSEQRLFRALAAFSGGWTLEAAAEVCGAGPDEFFEVLDLLARLVDKSMAIVAREGPGESRYRLLETMRQYALEKLDEAGEGASLRDRHLGYFLALAEAAEPRLWGADQAAWLARLEVEHENLIGALGWCERAEGGAAKAVRLAGSLWRFWTIHGHYRLGRRALAEALQREGGAEPNVARARALYGAGYLALWQGEEAAARPLFEESLGISRACGDRQGEARALSGLGLAAKGRGDYEAARSLYEQSLALSREVDDKRGMAAVLNNLGALAWAQSDFAAAGPLYEEGCRYGREAGDGDLTVVTLTGVGWISLQLGDRQVARARLTECVRLVKELGAKLRGAFALEAVAALARSLGEVGRAARLYGAAQALREAIGSPPDRSWGEAHAAIAEGIRHELGEESFARRWASGRALGFEPANEYALEWLERGPEPVLAAEAAEGEERGPG
ncbi:MAG TPA: protein kinase [Candidatus Eisenbacteria bacterium]